jgi:hypothetical protein
VEDKKTQPGGGRLPPSFDKTNLTRRLSLFLHMTQF